MVDLKNFAFIRAVATQGHPKQRKWTKEFAIKYSLDNQTWQKLYDNTRSKAWKVFIVNYKNIVKEFENVL